MAPDIFSKSYTNKVDIYRQAFPVSSLFFSLGIVMYEAFISFIEKDAGEQIVKTFLFSKNTSKFSTELQSALGDLNFATAKRLISSMVDEDPLKRPNASALLQSESFGSLEKETKPDQHTKTRKDKEEDEKKEEGDGKDSTTSQGKEIGQQALVLYEYKKASEDELDLKVNEIILDIREHKDDGWWIGHCNGKQGAFPNNFVKLLENQDSKANHSSQDAHIDKQSSQPSNLRAIAEWDYKAADDTEISFDPKDEITDIDKIDPGWWLGTCNGKHGLFPANYVKLVESDEEDRKTDKVAGENEKGDEDEKKEDEEEKEATVSQGKEIGQRALVLYEYNKANDDELDLKVNEIVLVIREHEDGWWFGRCKGKQGVFPDNFVKLLAK